MPFQVLNVPETRKLIKQIPACRDACWQGISENKTLLLRYGRGQQGIDQVGGRPVKDPVRHLLQGHARADDAEPAGGILNSQGPQRNA